MPENTFYMLCKTSLYTSFNKYPSIWITAPSSIHNHSFTLGVQYGWSVASKSQLHWQVTVNCIYYHYACSARPNWLHVCLSIHLCGLLKHVCPLLRWATMCTNSFREAANANELPNSMIRLWQMKTLTYSKIEIHRFQWSWFLNHHSWVLWLCIAVTFWTAVDSNGTFISMDHCYSYCTRDEIVECNVGWFHYHRRLVMSGSRTEQSLLKSAMWGCQLCSELDFQRPTFH